MSANQKHPIDPALIAEQLAAARNASTDALLQYVQTLRPGNRGVAIAMLRPEEQAAWGAYRHQIKLAAAAERTAQAVARKEAERAARANARLAQRDREAEFAAHPMSVAEAGRSGLSLAELRYRGAPTAVVREVATWRRDAVRITSAAQYLGIPKGRLDRWVKLNIVQPSFTRPMYVVGAGTVAARYWQREDLIALKAKLSELEAAAASMAEFVAAKRKRDQRRRATTAASAPFGPGRPGHRKAARAVPRNPVVEDLLQTILALPGDKIVTLNVEGLAEGSGFDIDAHGNIGYAPTHAAILRRYCSRALQVGGGLIVRQFLAVKVEREAPNGRKLWMPEKNIYGAFLGHGVVYGMPAVEVESAHCTDTETGKPLPREPGVRFMDWPIASAAVGAKP